MKDTKTHAEYVREMTQKGFDYFEGVNEAGREYYYFKRRVPVAEPENEGYPKNDLPAQPAVITGDWDLPF